MPTLQEVYQEIVGQLGQNSPAAKAVKLQIDSEALTKGKSAERFFVSSFQTNPKASQKAVK